MTQRYQCDTAIIGGGIAGIVAAIELLHANQRVVLMDRETESNFGGLAKESFGGMLMVDTPEQRRGRIKDSPALAYRDWLDTAEFTADDRLPRAWAECYVNESLEMIYHWLRARGIGFFPVVHWVERGLFTPGNSVPRFHMVWGTGHGLTTTLIQHLLNHPQRDKLTLLFRHRVDTLNRRDDIVCGCSGIDETGNSEFEVEAGNTIVASGGINGNLQKVRENWHAEWQSPPDILLNGSHHYADGRLHEAVGQLGGNITHLDRQWNYAAGVHHPSPRRPDHGLSLVPCPSALWLNSRGERIGPEPMVSGFDTRRLVTQVCQQPGQFSWQVLNWKIAVRELAVSGSEFNDAIRNKDIVTFLRNTLFGNEKLVKELTQNCQDFVTANSIDELAEKMNQLEGNRRIDPHTLRDTIDRYDRLISSAPALYNDDQIRRIAQLRQYRGNKIRTCKFQPINDRRSLPLIAIREFILSRKSLGGIQTNLDSQVLSQSDSIIPGLYAVGEAAGFGGGGMHGKRTLEGTFLGGCVLTARKAARAITN